MSCIHHPGNPTGRTVETYTVRRDGGRPTGIIIGRLDDGGRFLSTTEDGDLIALLIDDDSPGRVVRVRSFDYGNRCTLG